MAFPEDTKYEWLKIKLMAALVTAYPTSDDLIGFINDDLPNAIRRDMRSALGDEADIHKDLKDDLNALKAELTGD